MQMHGTAGSTPTDQIWSVSELSYKIKSLLESSISPCWIRGEISNLRQQSSGHIYFTLKDANSQISAALFRGHAIQQTVVLKEGIQVLLFGEVNVFEPRGTYQFIVRFVLEDGRGRLHLEFERLKQKLEIEGLFSLDKKKSIPILPRVVGFITSPSGAAIRDFISILKRRNWSGTVILLPSLVQGEEAALQMIEQLKVAEGISTLELLVIGRGGGSLEDLWCFNDERLVRAVATCTIPIISAVGHEIDFVLTDFAADKRAETPSSAAELISSHFVDCMNRFQFLQKQLEAHSPQRKIENAYFLLDDLQHRLVRVMQEKLHESIQKLHQLIGRFKGQDLDSKISLKKIQLEHASKSIFHRLDAQVEQMKQRVDQLMKRCHNLSIERVLKRGFALVKNLDGTIISRAQAAQKEDILCLQFIDNKIYVKTQEGDHNNESKSQRIK